MKVLFCASEALPFAKTGGLADVMGALPQSLVELGADVSLIMPYYKKIKEKNTASYLGYCYVTISGRSEYAGVFFEERQNVKYYFIDSDLYFNRDNLYGYGDDGERFAFFSFAVLEALKVINLFPDIIHLNDWQTGLIPYILKHNYYGDFRYENIKTVFSIHNIQYQGNFGADFASRLNIPYSSTLEFYGDINFMKTAIMESNKILTVSETYKNEVLTPEYGYRLNEVLQYRLWDFGGILNGIDVNLFNPETDKNITKNYNMRTRKSGKKANKRALLSQFGLDTEDVPLFGLVSRLADQKGIDLFGPIMDQIIGETNAKFILMGSGDSNLENYFRYLENKYPTRFKAYIGYNEHVAQQIYAGADIFLMPSKFEPCGLGQMIAMRYGTLPLVRETGGLKDTVKPYNRFEKTGNGFSFTNFNPNELRMVMMFAVDTYNNHREDFDMLIKNAMSADFSWKSSASKYLKIYQELCE